MKLFRILSALVLLLAVPALIFAAGAREPADTDGPVRLVIWGAVPAESGPGQVVDNFNAQHDHIQAEYVRYVNNDEGNARLDTALLAGEHIDIFISYAPSRREQRVEGGFALDMSELLGQFDMSLAALFGDGVESAYTRADGSVYSIPTNNQIQVILANKDALESIGVDLPIEPGTWSWDDYRDISVRLVEEAGFEYGSFHNFEHFMIDHWVRTSTVRRDQWIDENGQRSRWLEEPLLERSLVWFYDMMHEYQAQPTLETIISDGLQGQNAAMLLGGRVGMMADGLHRLRDVRNLAEYPRDFQVTILPVPSADTSGLYAAPIVTGDEFKINSNSRNPEAAMEFIRWYITEGFGPMIVGGRTPLYSGYPVDQVLEGISVDDTLPDGRDVLDMDSYLNVVLAEYSDIIVPGPDTARSEIGTIVREELEGYFLRLQSLDETLQSLHERTQSALDRANN